MKLQWSNGAICKKYYYSCSVYLSAAGKSCRKEWIIPDWMLLWFSAVFYIRKSTDWVGVTFFCDNWGITCVITASRAELSQAHKCESKHTCTAFPVLNTTQLPLTLFPLGNKLFCFLLCYPRCGDGCSENFTGACCSLTAGAGTIGQYFGECVFGFFAVVEAKETQRRHGVQKTWNVCSANIQCIVKCDKIFNHVG